MKKCNHQLDMITPPKSDYSSDIAVTLTLSPHMYTKHTYTQALLTKDLFLSSIANTSIICSAFLEETKEYNIHVHAIMKVRLTDHVRKHGVLRFIHDMFRNKNYGKIKDIGFVTSYDAWTKYIVKDFNIERYIEYCEYENKVPDNNKNFNREYYSCIIDKYQLLYSWPDNVSEDSSQNDETKREEDRAAPAASSTRLLQSAMAVIPLICNCSTGNHSGYKQHDHRCNIYK